jgi:cysteine desulfurase
MSISAHKLGGPQGVGALVARGSVPVMPQQTGGGQERGRRAGTENVPGIVGFGLACALASPEEWAGVAELRDELENRLLNAASDAVVFAGEVRRLPNTTCIAMPGVKAETQVMALDLAGVMVSAGAACSSGKVRPSHVLAAMGVGPALAASAIRISLGRTTTRGEIDRCVDAWTALHARTAARRNAA